MTGIRAPLYQQPCHFPNYSNVPFQKKAKIAKVAACAAPSQSEFITSPHRTTRSQKVDWSRVKGTAFILILPLPKKTPPPHPTDSGSWIPGIETSVGLHSGIDVEVTEGGAEERSGGGMRAELKKKSRGRAFRTDSMVCLAVGETSAM